MQKAVQIKVRDVCICISCDCCRTAVFSLCCFRGTSNDRTCTQEMDNAVVQGRTAAAVLEWTTGIADERVSAKGHVCRLS